MDSLQRIGLMGCGAVAMYGHLPALIENEQLELAAVFDPSAERLQQVREQLGVTAGFTDVEAFFKAGLDAVTITSPAPAHFENVLACAERGLPVLCEKPLAMNENEARQMIAAMHEAHTPLYTAFCYRYSPVAMKIRQLVREQAIGEVRSLRLVYTWDVHGKYVDRNPAAGLSPRREGRMAEGGPMVDCGTHQIDLARWWLQSPVINFAGHGAWIDGYEAPEHIWLHMDHACGAHCCVEISYAYGHTLPRRRAEFVYELIGTDGLIRYDRERKSFELHTGEGTTPLPFAHEKSFAGLYAEWAHSLIHQEQRDMCPADAGMEVTHIARTVTDQLIAQHHAKVC